MEKLYKKITSELLIIRKLIYNRLSISRRTKEDVINRFHELYYNSCVYGGTWINTRWLGIPTKKCPLDLWIYQEIITELKPDIIIETGTMHGGSALFLASICTMIGSGRIISVDLTYRKTTPGHDRITYLLGSSISDQVLNEIRDIIKPEDRVLVILDSDHHKDHVLKELETYQTFVTKGSYIIVEDTNLNGYPVEKKFGPGPMEAVNEFLDKYPKFEVDSSREKFYMTFNPKGFLRRI